MYRSGVDLVLDHEREVFPVAAELAICPRLLEVWVANTRFNLQAVAEIAVEIADEEGQR